MTGRTHEQRYRATVAITCSSLSSMMERIFCTTGVCQRARGPSARTLEVAEEVADRDDRLAIDQRAVDGQRALDRVRRDGLLDE